MSWENLDLSCARTAEKIAAKARDLSLSKQQAEGLVTDAASVLSHQGPGAFFLYLKSKGPKPPKNPKKPNPAISNMELWVDYLSRRAFELLQPCVAPAEAGSPPEDSGSIEQSALRRLEEVERISETLSRLALAKRLLDQAMTYLRYHAKTLPDSQGGN